MAEWSEGRVTANGVNIHYHRTGASEEAGESAGARKPAMLLLHGITDNGLCWTRVALDLQDHFDVVMTDARGHGSSDRLGNAFSVPMLAADAAGVIRGLGLGKPVVFGHSMGAITAAALAADYPELVSAILLEDPPLREVAASPPSGFINGLRKEFASYKDMSPAQRTARGTLQNPGWHPIEIEPWGQSKAEVDAAVLNQVGSFDSYPWKEAFQRIQCPGLLIIGDPARQAIVTEGVAQQAMALWPNGEMVQLTGAGHCIHHDRYEATLAAIQAYLERQGLL